MSLFERLNISKLLHHLVFLFSFLLSDFVAISAAASEQIWTNVPYAEALRCGPNALFVFLLLEGHTEIRLEQLNDLPITPEGTSFLDLRERAARFGLEAEVRLYDILQADALPLPALGQFKSDLTAVSSNHFGVVYKVDSKRVYFIDGTTGAKKSGTKAWFANYWTGYAMTRRRSIRLMTPWRELASPVSVSGVLLVDVILVGMWLRTRKGQASRQESTLPI